MDDKPSLLLPVKDRSDRLYKLRRHTATLYSFDYVSLTGIADYLRTRSRSTPDLTGKEMSCLRIHGAIWVSPDASSPTFLFRREQDEAETIHLSNDLDQVLLTLTGPFYPVRYSFTDCIYIYLYDGEMPLAFGSIDLNDSDPKQKIGKPTSLDFMGLQIRVTVGFTIIRSSVPANLKIEILGDNSGQDQEELILSEGMVTGYHKLRGAATSDFTLSRTPSGTKVRPGELIPLDRSVVVVPVGGDSSLIIKLNISGSSSSSGSSRDVCVGEAEFKLTGEHLYKTSYDEIICEGRLKVTIRCVDNYSVDCGRDMRAKAQAKQNQILQDYFCPLVTDDEDDHERPKMDFSPHCLEIKFARLDLPFLVSWDTTDFGFQVFGEIKVKSQFMSKAICIYSKQLHEADTIPPDVNEYLYLSLTSTDKRSFPRIPVGYDNFMFVSLYSGSGDPLLIREFVFSYRIQNSELFGIEYLLQCQSMSSEDISYSASSYSVGKDGIANASFTSYDCSLTAPIVGFEFGDDSSKYGLDVAEGLVQGSTYVQQNRQFIVLPVILLFLVVCKTFFYGESDSADFIFKFDTPPATTLDLCMATIAILSFGYTSGYFLPMAESDLRLWFDTIFN